MLKSTNRLDKSKSQYECDKCKEIITLENKYTIYTCKGQANARKQYDLCDRCYNTVNQFIAENEIIKAKSIEKNSIQMKDLKKAKNIIQNKIELNNSLIKTAKQIQKDAATIEAENKALETAVKLIEIQRKED